MSRDSAILLGANGWNSGADLVQLDPLFGGQFAYATNPSEWLSAQGHLPRNLIPFVLEAPRFFQHMPNSDKWVEAYRVFWEKHARVIEGLKAGLTVETAEHDFGAGGEKFEEFTDVKRERSTLSVQTVDKYGNTWQNFYEKYIMYGMMHPETKTPLTMTMVDGPTDHLSDNYSGTIAFVEPDATGKRCQRCWIGANIFPKSNGPVEGKMDKNSALSIKDLSLEFTILAFYGEGTRVVGQMLMDAITTTWANPNIKNAFINSVSADVAKVARGYKESVETIGEKTNRVGDTI